MTFRQLFDESSSTYSYLLADDGKREAVLIDPVKEQLERDLSLLDKLGLSLKWVLETHVHADHITAAAALRSKTGAKSAVSSLCGAQGFDRYLNDDEILAFGNEYVRVIAVPGHTRGSVCYLWRDRLMSGDSLMIGGCGRCDFQHGDPGALYDSIVSRLFALPDETLLYPGHDYRGRWVSAIGEEKRSNPRIAGKTREEFIEIMNHLNLPMPARINEAVPANLKGGL